VAGRGCDDDSGAAGRDHVRELLQDERGSVQIDRKDHLRLCLTGRHARRMDDARDVATGGRTLRERVDRLARGHIHGGSADVKAGIGQNLSRRIRVRLVEIGEEDMLAGADPPGDRLADLARADYDGDFAHQGVTSTLIDSRSFIAR
jgi:hypothetical protein